MTNATTQLFDVSWDRPFFFDPLIATEEELEEYNQKKRLEELGG